MDNLVFEEYRLTLTHNYVTNGKRVQLSLPVVTSMIVDRNLNAPSSVVVNDMIERMKTFVLNELREDENER